MSARNLRCLVRVLAVTGLAASALAGGVRIVERPNLPPFATIQAGVDAALPGETLLIGRGDYPGFSVVAKSLSVVGEPVGPITINGTITVANLPATETVLLSGLVVLAPFVNSSVAPPGVKLASNAGHIRIESCTIVGGSFHHDEETGGAAGAEIVACPRVVFVACTVMGGMAGGCAGCPVGTAGDGVDAFYSGMTLYDCTLQGGKGDDETVPAGDGGHGFFASSWGVVASGCTFTGGQGGAADYVVCEPSGNGGDGLRSDAAQAHLLDVAAFGGGAGPASSCGLGQPGQPITNQGGVVDWLAGTRRKLTAPAIASDAVPLAVTLSGQTGDRVFVLVARKPSYLFIKAFHGTWCLPLPSFLTSVPFAVLQQSGPTNLSIPLPNLQAPEVDRVLFYQAWIVDAAGFSYLTSPQQVLLLDRDAAPDCNGNGVFDLIDTTLGIVPDANNNFIPDVCGS